MRNAMDQLLALPSRLLATCVTLYQRTLSPDHGPLSPLFPYGYCRHEPTCSEYTKEMLLKRGAIVGTFLGIKRVLSCNPWTKISDEKWRKLAEKQR